MTGLFFPIRLTHENARLPSQEPGDVGFDLFAVEDTYLQPRGITEVRTGIALAGPPELVTLPSGVVMTPFLKVEGRSGLALTGVFPVGGIIDPSFRGEIRVLLFCLEGSSYDPKMVCEGDRIAQLVCYMTLSTSDAFPVGFVKSEESVPSSRGDKGFGSSGR